MGRGAGGIDVERRAPLAGTTAPTLPAHARQEPDGTLLVGGQVVGADALSVTVNLWRIGARTLPAARFAGLSTRLGAPVICRMSADLATVLDVRDGRYPGGDEGTPATVARGLSHFAVV
jgi:hypothetical protein